MLASKSSLSVLAMLLAAGCVGGGGGGGGGSFGGTVNGSGGTAGSVCSADLVTEGCNGTNRMKCDAATKQWAQIEACGAGMVCKESPDGNGKVKTSCQAAQAGGSDTGGGTSDATSGDTGSGLDGPITTKADTVTDSGGGGAVCGNGKCEEGESTQNCSKDCPPAGPVCGNGACENGETPEACPQDCSPDGPKCGNGQCESGESTANCPQDCGDAPKCGNGVCDPGETPTSCAADCKNKPVCGNGKCEAGETASSCAADCAAKPVCGNGVCEPGETQSSCSKDCKGTLTADCSGSADYSKIESSGYSAVFQEVVSKCVLGGGCLGKTGDQMSACISDCLVKNGSFTPECSQCIGSFSACAVSNCMGQCGSTPSAPACQSCAMSACGGILAACGAPPMSSGPVCGNGVCESGETKANCSKDCGTAGPVCGNGVCESGETKTTCSKDCGTAGPTCGDFKCDSGESASTCPADCDPTNQCVFSACPDEVQACIAEPKCATLLQCLGGCKQGDNACGQSCASSAGAGAVQLYTSLGTCAQGSGCVPSAKCGNGTCESGETASNCPSDCATTSGHICDKFCGSKPTGASCYCDSTCKTQGDCCNAAGTGVAGKACTGSTCASCK